jgi:hypothetical protein
MCVRIFTGAQRILGDPDQRRIAMIERVYEVPDGVIGLHATGKLSRADYTEALEPALHEGVESSELRLVFVLAGRDGARPGPGSRT